MFFWLNIIDKNGNRAPPLDFEMHSNHQSRLASLTRRRVTAGQKHISKLSVRLPERRRCADQRQQACGFCATAIEDKQLQHITGVETLTSQLAARKRQHSVSSTLCRLMLRGMKALQSARPTPQECRAVVDALAQLHGRPNRHQHSAGLQPGCELKEPHTVLDSLVSRQEMHASTW